eukprot:gene12196-25620_t
MLFNRASKILLLVIGILLCCNQVVGFLITSRTFRHNSNDLKCAEKDYENKKVDKGLTHIKYNKFAPTPEEAANMTDEEFRATIYKRMKAEEIERRKMGPVGGATADSYLNNLSKKKT